MLTSCVFDTHELLEGYARIKNTLTDSWVDK